METKNPKSITHLQFNLINPHALAYARTHLSDILGPLKERGREIIHDYVTRAVGGEFTPQQVARLIRDNALALTTEQILASDVYWKDLIKKKLDSNTIKRRMTKFNARQLQDRAETIAFTEVLRAAKGGQLESWREAARQRLLDPSEWQRVWHAVPDDRTCEDCKLMDGVVAKGLEEAFTVNRKGEAVDNSFGEQMEFADKHPRCRCWIGLEKIPSSAS